MCERYYLVDSENVHLNGLNGIEKLTKDDNVIIFTSTETSKKERKIIEEYKKTLDCNVMTMEVINGSKNALDFQLVSYLGLLIGENKEKEREYYIVSEDKGFVGCINLFSNYYDKYSIKRMAKIKDISSSDLFKTRKSYTSIIENKLRDVNYVKLHNEVFDELNKRFKNKKTCKKIINIMKLTNDKGLALDMIEKLLTGLDDWRDRIEYPFELYYSLINN